MPPGTDTTYMIRLTKGQLVRLLWSVKSFKISGAQFHVPGHGQPGGAVADTYADFYASNSDLGGTINGSWTLGHGYGPGEIAITPHSGSGLDFILRPQAWGGAAAENVMGPDTVTGTTPSPPPYTITHRSCFFQWGSAWSSNYSGGPLYGTAASAFYDRTNDCFWVTPPCLVFFHGRCEWGPGVPDPSVFTWWGSGSNCIACTDSSSWYFGIPIGNMTMNLWDLDPILIPIVSTSASNLGTGGTASAITASATVSIHEEWDYS